MLDVRPETPADFDAIRELHAAAFAPSDVEPRLVDRLRADGDHVPELSLVATDDDAVVGHVLFSRATLGEPPREILVLAPMAVTPHRQRSGIGAALVTESLKRARETVYPLVSVLGHAEYYPRFGFGPASALGISPPFEVPDEAWMAYPLPRYTPDARGTVRYASAFGSV